MLAIPYIYIYIYIYIHIYIEREREKERKKEHDSYENNILCKNMRTTNNNHRIKIKNNKQLGLKHLKFQIEI